MATVVDEVKPETLADLLERIGNVPPERILAHPAPGTATERDAERLLEAPNKRLVELVDGVLVEKTMGAEESLLASYIGHLLWAYLEEHDHGLVLGSDGMLRLMPGLIRGPDASFLSWEQLPGGRLPKEKIPRLAPRLAIEVLSDSNTPGEMRRKRKDYFENGVEELWIIDPKTQTAEVYTSETAKRKIPKTGTLDGGTILPGFKLPLKTLFERGRRKKKGNG